MSKEGRQKLSEILQLARASMTQNSEPNCLAVFDLDSTLFDVHPRIQRVIEEFTNLETTQRDFPDAIPRLRAAKVQPTDWGIRSAILRAGLESYRTELHDRLKAFWLENFFSNSYLHFDKPYDGAVAFVKALWHCQVHIAYLTGRDVARMGTGTVEVLKKWHFPVAEPRAELILKPLKGMDDADFKLTWFENIPKEKFKHIWFFENEPMNIHPLLKRRPEVEVIFFDSTHSGKAERPLGVHQIQHFVPHDDGSGDFS